MLKEDLFSEGVFHLHKQFNLSQEQKEDLQNKIRDYFLKERDEELGDLAAALLLEFVMEELAPAFYNIGVSDAHQFMADKLEDVFEIQK